MCEKVSIFQTKYEKTKMVIVKRKSVKKNTAIIVALATLLLGAGALTYYKIMNDPDTEQKIVKTKPIKIDDSKPDKTATDDTATDETDDSTDDNADDQSSEEDNTKKPVAQQVKSTTKPSVNTDYGHSPDSPLPLNETTNTSCSVSPGSICKIILTNQTTKKVREFATQTSNDQGIAVWQWKGEDVGAGTWVLEAVSGDKKSDKETIYIR